jgi:methylenetetrahydrofolate--tRNA-(uracil-5-)-methyltransferase
MKVGEQKRVFRLIPGLENVEFLRYGSVHRNTYVFSPKKLDRNFKIKDRDIYIAGQLSGVEGYVESIGSGLVAAIDLFLRLKYDKFLQLPENSALRALGDYVSTYRESEFSPSNFHFGMLKPLDTKIKDKKKKKIMLSERAIKSLEEYVISLPI